MAKDKKAKKGQGEETGEEVVSKEIIKGEDSASVGQMKKNKKSRKGEDSVDGSIIEELSEVSLQNKKKGKKSAAVENGDSDDYEGAEIKSKQKDSDGSKDGKKGKVSKKGKAASVDSDALPEVKTKKKPKSKRSGAVDSDDDDIISKMSLEKTVSIEENDDNSIDNKKKSQKKKGKTISEPDGFGGKSAKFQLLDIEDDDMVGIDDNNDEVIEKNIPEVQAEVTKDEQKGGKKSKKKARKKKDDDDEDLDKLLEELALEMTGQKVEQPAEKAKDTAEAENKIESTASTEANVVDGSEQKSKKKKKKKDVVEQTEEPNDKEPSPPVDTDEQHTVKTVAEKKKEKREKEKQKRIAQFERQGKTEGKAKPLPEDEPILSPTQELSVKDEEDKEDAEDVDDKKKKKKKKKDEEEKKDKKRPGKKQIAAMQEALKKVREEEEKARLEEEARIKAEEEAEKLRLEKLRLEQERKEKKKQKEKEKRERLKAEGKLLTKAQRQQKARLEATLAALRQQGVEVPQIGEKKERIPRLGDRQRNRKEKNKKQPDEELVKEETETTNVIEEVPHLAEEQEKNESFVSDKDKDEDDVKEAWDETSDDDYELPSKKKTALMKQKSKGDSEESESEESDSSEESEEESESEESSSESEADGKTNEEKLRERALERIRKRREDAENSRSTSKLRSPVVCVLGHVDTGKTKILDKIRKTNVQSNEVGGITQQIGATMVPQEALKEQCKMVKNFAELELQVPGLLIIDTPGHESFSNLRSRGSSLCDIAVLVVDIMHGLEPQTIESINLLKQKKTPFIVALNKIDRLYEWKSVKNKDIHDVIKGQSRNTKMEFDDRVKEIVLQFANQGLNAVLYYDNKDPRSYLSMVPTSAISGDGMGNLMALVVQLTQSMMAKRLAFSEELQATVLEVKAIPGLGTTVDVILVNGRLREGDTMLLAGYDGPVITQIRSLLMPQPLKELRVKSPYQEFKEVEGAQGVKITGKDLDKAIAGLQLLIAHHPDEVAVLKDEIASSFREAMSSIKLAERGVYVQASTLGSLEALLDFLRTSKIPYSGIRIGPVVKKDVMKASIMLEHDSQYAVILAFDVKIERDAQELADSLGVKIFQADIIYHLFDRFMEYREELKNKKKDEFKNVAVFPCKLRILPQFIFNSRDPIVVGVVVEAGVVKEGTPLCVPSKEFLEIGTVSTIEINHKAIECARKGQEVCIKIEPSGGEAPKMYGRHFDHTDILVSKITRQSIDVCKEYFRDDLAKTDWQLMVELKKIFQIL